MNALTTNEILTILAIAACGHVILMGVGMIWAIDYLGRRRWKDNH